jgi:hypothetical protein
MYVGIKIKEEEESPRTEESRIKKGNHGWARIDTEWKPQIAQITQILTTENHRGARRGPRIEKHLGLRRGRTNRTYQTNQTDKSDKSDRKKGLGRMRRLKRFNGWKKGVEKGIIKRYIRKKLKSGRRRR